MPRKLRFVIGRNVTGLRSAMALAFGFIIGSAEAQTKSAVVHRLSTLALMDDRQVPTDLPASTAPATLRIAPGQRDDLVPALADGAKIIPGVTVEAGVLKGPDNTTLHIPTEEIRAVICAYVPTGGIWRGVRVLEPKR